MVSFTSRLDLRFLPPGQHTLEAPILFWILLTTSEESPTSKVQPHPSPGWRPPKQAVTASWWETTALSLSTAFHSFPPLLSALKRTQGGVDSPFGFLRMSSLATLSFTGPLQVTEQDKERPRDQLQYVDLIWSPILTNCKNKSKNNKTCK